MCETVEALYDYDAEQPDELTFRVDDIIENCKVVGDGWMEGELNGRKGMFPDNFVKKVEVAPPAEPTNVPLLRGKCGETVEVMYDYDAEDEDELTLYVGDLIMDCNVVEDGWMDGDLYGERGLFPLDCVKKVDALEAVEVMHNYDAEDHDELTLRVGDIVKNCKVHDWWMEGDLNGKRGLFPGNYVKKFDIPDDNMIRRVKVVSSYYPEIEDELELQSDDEVILLDDTKEFWWKGRIGDEEGYFPSTCVVEIPEANEPLPSHSSPVVKVPSTSDNAEKIQCVLVGDEAVGKTCLVETYRHNKFPDENVAEWVDAAYVTHELKGTLYNLVLIDTPAQEDYDRIRTSYYHNADVLLVCFSVDNQDSFWNAMRKWIPDINHHCPNTPFLLLGLKVDLRDDGSLQRKQFKKDTGFILSAEAERVAKEFGSVKYLECSAVTQEGLTNVLDVAALLKKGKKHVEKEMKKIEEQKRRVLKQSLTRAIKQHGIVRVRFLKIFFTGSGAAGKTSFVQLLLKKQFNKKYHSTNVVHTNHAVSVKKAVFHVTSEKNEVNWVELDKNLEISFLQSVLTTKFQQPSSPQPNKNAATLQSPKKASRKPLPSVKQAYRPPKKHNTSIKQKLPGFFKPSSSVKDSNLLTFDSFLKSSSTNFHQPGEVLNMITLLDTGGQPQYIHLLPTINIFPTVTFVVHDLSKSLDDQVFVEYSQHGERVFVPHHLNYSNMDMIKLLISAANDAVERPPYNIPYLVAKPSSNNAAFVCLVGTHADMVDKEIVKKSGHHLETLVNSMNCKAAVWHNENGGVLFPVDNTTAGKDTEDPVADVLRNKIEMLAEERDIYELPISWMLFQLEIQQACSERKKSYIHFDECVALARNSRIISDHIEVKSVLLYYHLLGVLIYFDKVPGLCDYVIVDHQWWFDKLSSIVTSTFQQTQLRLDAVQKLKYEGILSKELLKCIEWKDDIKEEFFLALLVHMKIIAAVVMKDSNEKQYFMPFVLPTYNVQQESIVLAQHGHLQGNPFLIRFQSGLLPRGLFCSLIVELLQNSPQGWRPHFSQKGTHYTFSNLIIFSLPNAYSLSLFDKVSYLEVQLRHPEEAFQYSVHNEIRVLLMQAITRASIHLNFDHSRLECGFLCDCNSHSHIAIVPKISPSLLYAQCSLATMHPMKLNSSHLIWVLEKQTLTASNDENKSLCLDDEWTKKTTSDQPAIKRPAMKLLHEVVVPRIAANWKLVADYLEYELEYKQVIMKKGHHDPTNCCEILLEDWLSSNRGVSPKNWSKLIEILKEIKPLRGAIEKILSDLETAGVSTE